MRILREDENQLVFNVYPTKYFLLFMIFLLLVMIYNFSDPGSTNSPFWSFIFQNNIIIENIITIVITIGLLYILIASYAMPIRIAIDKVKKTITYRYFAGFENPDSSKFQVTKVIPINDLSELVYTNKMPELKSRVLFSGPMGKYLFMLKDNSSIDIYADFFSMFPHRYAFMKISEYLKFPYKIDNS
jgi:hypothetical protein